MEGVQDPGRASRGFPWGEGFFWREGVHQGVSFLPGGGWLAPSKAGGSLEALNGWQGDWLELEALRRCLMSAKEAGRSWRCYGCA